MSKDSVSERIIGFLLSNEGKDVLQSELWKELGLTSKELSKALKKLEEEGVIKREPVTYKGKRTYRITLVADTLARVQKTGLQAGRLGRLVVSKLVDEVLDIPCVSCPFINRCYEGGFYDPVNCQFINEWVLRHGQTKSTR